MPRKLYPNLLACWFASITLGAPLAASAHHGWSNYDGSQTLELTGVIRSSTYEQPHGMLQLQAGDKTWRVVLAPPTRMQQRGLERDMLKTGRQVTLTGYPHRSDVREMRAENITVDGKTIPLR